VTTRAAPARLAEALAPLIALLAFAALHGKGIGMIQDGWAAWQGAVSIAQGHGYTYFTGNPIVAWPPLYSTWLALGTLLCGPTGLSLVLSNGLLIVLQAWAWMRLVLRLARDTDIRLSLVPQLLLAAFLGLFLAVNQMQVFSHVLVYLFLPLYLGALWSCLDREALRPVDLMLPVVLGTALVLTHNTAVVFVGMAAIMLALRAHGQPNLFVQLLMIAVPTVLPFVAWDLLRLVLNQTGSHHVGLGAGKYGPLDYLLQLIGGPAALLVSDRAGIAYGAALALWGLAAWLCRNAEARALRFAAQFALGAGILLFALFNVTWVFNTLSSPRYILFVPLLLVPVTFLTALPLAPRTASLVLALLLLPQLYWTGQWTARQQRSTFAELDVPGGFAPIDGYLSRDYLTGPTVRTPRGLLMPPLAGEEPKDRQHD